MKKLFLFILCLLSSYTAFAINEGGTVGGGGGTGVKNKYGNLVLIDFVNFDPDLLNKETTISRPLPLGNGENVVKIDLPLFNAQGKIDKVIKVKINDPKQYEGFTSDPAVLKAKTILLQYGVALMVPYLCFETIEWLFTDDLPEKQDRYDSEGALTPNTETLAYYYSLQKVRRRFAVIPVKRWNRMDELSRVGLIVHETLRHFQISSEGTPMKPGYSETVLQRTTALLTLCEYNDGIEPYFHKLLRLGAHYTFETAKSYCQKTY